MSGFITEAVPRWRPSWADAADRFAGGPFTLASYLVEGGPSKSHDLTK